MVDRIQYCYYRDDFIETTKSNLDKIYNFWIEAFDGFEGVSFEITGPSDTTSAGGKTYYSQYYLYIYLNSSKTFYLKFYYNLGTTVTNGSLCIDIIKDDKTYELLIGATPGSIENGNFLRTHMYYKTNYGLIFNPNGLYNNTFQPGTGTDYSFGQKLPYFNTIFIPGINNNTTLFWNIDSINTTLGSAESVYPCLLTDSHEEKEILFEKMPYLSSNLGDQKMALVNAYSYVVPVYIPYLYRVFARPSVDYPYGRIRVGGINLIWFGRYALQIEND